MRQRHLGPARKGVELNQSAVIRGSSLDRDQPLERFDFDRQVAQPSAKLRAQALVVGIAAAVGGRRIGKRQRFAQQAVGNAGAHQTVDDAFAVGIDRKRAQQPAPVRSQATALLERVAQFQQIVDSRQLVAVALLPQLGGTRVDRTRAGRRIEEVSLERLTGLIASGRVQGCRQLSRLLRNAVQWLQPQRLQLARHQLANVAQQAALARRQIGAQARQHRAGVSGCSRLLQLVPRSRHRLAGATVDGDPFRVR